MTILYACMLGLGLAYFIFKVRWDLHMFQKSHYEPKVLFEWMNETQQPIIKKSDWMFAIGSGIALLPSLSQNLWISWLGFALGLPFIALSLMMFHVKTTWQPQPIRLDWNPRVRRMLITAFIWLNLLYTFAYVSHGVWFIWLALLFSVIYSWALVLCANLTNTPIEALIGLFYQQDAGKRIAAHENLTVLTVTGAPGPVSEKELLSLLLSPKYEVLTTPKGANTRKDLIQVLRHDLKPTHDIFLVELHSETSVKEVCELVHPNAGLLIYPLAGAAKGVNSSGTIYVNLNDENLRKAKLRRDVTTVTFGSGLHKKADYLITYEDADDNGTQLTVQHSKYRERHTVEFKTHLKGKEAINLLLGAIAVAMEMGVTAEQINKVLYDYKPEPIIEN